MEGAILNRPAFWPRAWATLEALRQSNPAEEALSELVQDLVLQAYVFDHSGFSDARLFDEFLRVGLFANPPTIKKVPQGLIAQPWPALTYLRSISSARSNRVSRVLGLLDTDNWWVIAQSLEIAVDVNASPATFDHLLRLWERAPLRWTGSETLSRTVAILGKSFRGAARISSLISHIIATLLREAGSSYELRGFLSDLTSKVRRHTIASLADGLEGGLAGYLVASHVTRIPLALQSWEADDDPGRDSDSISILVRAWVDIIAIEIAEFGPSHLATRAARLISKSHSIFHRMGLRALAMSLDGDATDPLAIALLRGVLTDEGWLTSWEVQAELRVLLARHFPLLSSGEMTDFLNRVGAWAESDSRRDRYTANRLIQAVLPWIGPNERILAVRLEGELGRPADYVASPEFEWVIPAPPVPPERLAEMDVIDALAWTRYIPSQEGKSGVSAAPEWLGRALQEDFVKRPSDYAPYLNEIATSTRYQSVLHSFLRGLEAVLKSDSDPRSVPLPQVLQFLSAALARADAGGFMPEEDLGFGASSLRAAVADAIQSAPEFFMPADPGVVEQLLRSVLGDNDPTLEHEAQYGGDNMDPLTLAINSARGKGLKATLDLLARSWDTLEASELQAACERIVVDVARAESSPSVRSVFGLYLPWLLRRWPGDANEGLALLLPSDSQHEREWEAVLTTYLVFRPAFRDVADNLLPHYRLATTRLSDEGYRFLHKNADRLLIHLISLSLSEQSRGQWFRLLEEALRIAPDESCGAAIEGAAHGALRSELDVGPDWVLDLIEARLQVGDDQASPGHAELSALLELLLVAPLDAASTGTHAVALIGRGANVDVNDVIRYLRSFDDRRSSIGAELLLSATARALEGDPWFTDEDELRSEINRYVEAGRVSEMWRLVNLLGANRRFFVEEEARQLSERAPVVASE